MKSRLEIKALARDALREQRGAGILILLIFLLIVIAGSLLDHIPFIGSLLVLATVIFIDYPLAVNVEGAFIKIFNREKTGAGEIFDNLSVNYLRKAGGMLWMTLWVTLWTLLLVIPGVIKSISYSMTGYILADCPNVTATEALKLSMRMTNGHKLELFIAGLSFIGWMLLSALTLGILYIVYVGPYIHITFAGYYVGLRDKALDSGVIERSELAGESEATSM